MTTSYLANVVTAIGDVAVAVDLKTAKTLAQLQVDRYRTDELHEKQFPINWERGHSDSIIYWTGYIFGEPVFQFESL